VSVNYSLPVRTNRLQQVLNAIDGGPSNGFMRLLDAGGNVLSSFQLSRPSGTISGAVLTFNGLSLIDPSAIGGGSATGARVEDSAGTIVISGLALNTDFFLSPGSFITAGQTVAITAATITGN
jgi:hypothetical protein